MKNILAASIGTETNTFSPVPTELENFCRDIASPGIPDERQQEFSRGAGVVDYFRSTRTVAGGYIAASEKHGMDLNVLMWTWATPGGRVRKKAYDFLKGLLLKRLDEAGSYEGILLDLHGAMVAEGVEDVEGDILAAVREKVGDKIPVVVTLDFHANVTPFMARHADVIVGYDLYPHTDMYERGFEAAEIMASILNGKIRPVLAYRQLPLITLPPKQCTLIEPMLSLLAEAHAMEQQDNVVNVTLSMGFPFSDIREAGVSVMVTADRDSELAHNLAAKMAGEIWEKRDEFSVKLTPVAEAIDYSRSRKEGLVVLADGSDNPGGGGPCDGTVILRQFIEEKVQNAVVAIIADPESVELSIRCGVGNVARLNLGGKTDSLHGEPVRLDAYVKLISDGVFVQEGLMGGGAEKTMGRAAVLVKDGVEIVVTERRIQPYDTALLRSVGIEPTRRRIIALKSAVHFRGTYQAISERIFDADTPGVHRADFSNFKYRNLRRPMYPLQKDILFNPVKNP